MDFIEMAQVSRPEFYSISIKLEFWRDCHPHLGYLLVTMNSSYICVKPQAASMKVLEKKGGGGGGEGEGS